MTLKETRKLLRSACSGEVRVANVTNCEHRYRRVTVQLAGDREKVNAALGRKLTWLSGGRDRQGCIKEWVAEEPL